MEVPLLVCSTNSVIKSTSYSLLHYPLLGENADLKDSKEELIRLRRENAILNRRLQTAREGSAHSDDSLDGRGGASDLSPKLALADKPRVGSKKSGGGGGGGGRGESSYGGSILSVSAGGDGFENVTMSPDARSESHDLCRICIT